MLSQIQVQVLTGGLSPLFQHLWPSCQFGRVGCGWIDYVLVCAASKVSDCHHLLEQRIPGFGCAPTQAAKLHSWCPGYMALYVREGFNPSSKASWSGYHESRVFHICSKINNFYVDAFSEGLLFTSKHIKGKLSKMKKMSGTGSL